MSEFADLMSDDGFEDAEQCLDHICDEYEASVSAEDDFMINEAEGRFGDEEESELASSAPRFIKRDIPWPAVIAFHREIARRAEESFFQLPLSNTPSDRWSAILDFDPPDLSGNWLISKNKLSESACRAWDHNAKSSELYIGGPCWPVKRNDGAGWRTEWCPFFYRAIRLDSTDDGSYRVVPEQGTWDISPIVLGVLDRKGFAPAIPLAQLAVDWFQTAGADVQDEHKSVTQQLREAVCNNIPDFAALFDKPVYNIDRLAQPPTPWVVFAAPQGGQLTKHLVADYDRLLAIAGAEQPDLGGLRLFEGYPETDATTDQEPSPIVALNDSQRTAVQGILAAKPVTVISGPPGCGKSQVVLSLLLNAWQRGISVLFSSNNNQAVDVVRERLTRFEENFPISVRAGSHAKSNVVHTLADTLNYITGKGPGATHAENDIKLQQSDLVTRVQVLRRFLASKLPQQVDEAVRSALGAYGKYQTTLSDLREREEKLLVEFRAFKIQANMETLWEEVGVPFESWLKRVSYYENLIAEDCARRSSLAEERMLCADTRDAALRSVGIDTACLRVSDLIVSKTGPENFCGWFKRYEALLGNPLECSLEPFEWEEGYSRWPNEQVALTWCDDAEALACETRRQCAALAEKHFHVESVRMQMLEQKANLEQMNVPPEVRIAPELLGQWATAYAADTSLIESRTDWFPWSDRSRARRIMRRIERTLRAVFPLVIWRGVGRLDLAGRGKLSGVVEQTKRWISLRSEWDSLQPVCEELDASFSVLRGRSNDLKPKMPAPRVNDITQWQEFADVLDNEVRYAAVAATAWKRRIEADAVREDIRAVTAGFFAPDLADSVKEAWAAGGGQELWATVTELHKQQTPESVVRARSACCSVDVNKFVESWKQVREVQKRLHDISKEVDSIPSSRERSASWRAEMPRQLFSICDVPIDTLPGQHDPVFLKLSTLCDWKNRRQEYYENEVPLLQRKAREELDWARDSLKSALDLLPSGDQRLSVESTIQRVIASEDWPAAEVQRAFEEFNPARITASISGLEAQLEAISFNMAKLDWLSRMATDHNVQAALDGLHRHYCMTNGRLEEAVYPVFLNALKALPIWITTAMSPQSIPMEAGVFDLLVIDEATQCTVTNILPLIYRAKRLVVIGDSEQLPAIPTVGPAAEAALATRFGVDHDLLDVIGHAENDLYRAAIRCISGGRHSVIQLDEHYRSHPLIIGFSNQYVYQTRLKLRTQSAASGALPFGSAVHGRHVSGQCVSGPHNSSWVNQAEAEAIGRLLSEICATPALNALSVGIVTPFKPQEELISAVVRRAGHLDRVEIGTAHKFQGDERDIIIFGPVVARGISDGAARWVENPRNLINVAITRARVGLFVVADFEVCRTQPGILGNLIKYVESVELLRKTSLEELELFSWMVVQGWNPQVHRVEGDIEIDFTLSNQGRRLAIEVDGRQHEQTTEADSARDAFLRGMGYDVLRVSARAVRETPSLLIRRIAEKTGLPLPI